jgi:hypothetical protein
MDLQASWCLASGEGGASAVLEAILAHTAWITGSKIGTATPPPVESPSVRRTEGIGGYPMPTEMTEHRSESSSIDAPATGKAGAAVDRDAKLPQTDLASKPVPPGGQRSTRRRRLLMAVLGVLVLAVASVFGIPWIRLALSTVSTDDAFVNGHVTFVAARVHGQVSRVLVDDNNRVHKGDLLVELDKEPFQDAVG